MGRDNDSYLQAFILVGFSDPASTGNNSLRVYLNLLHPDSSGQHSHHSFVCHGLQAPHTHVFFLGNLSFLDLYFLWGMFPSCCGTFGVQKTITYHGCVAQLYIYMVLGSTGVFSSCHVLAATWLSARPLPYTAVMHSHLCLQLVTVAWCCGFLNSFVMCPQTMHLSRCGRREVDHFLCEMPALIAMSCADTMLVEAFAFVLGVALLLVPLSLILISYGMITAAALRIKSAAGSARRLSTPAHLT